MEKGREKGREREREKEREEERKVGQVEAKRLRKKVPVAEQSEQGGAWTGRRRSVPTTIFFNNIILYFLSNLSLSFSA